MARGMDIEGIDYIFNYDLRDEEFYLHRAGQDGPEGGHGDILVEEGSSLPASTQDTCGSLEQIGLDEAGRVFSVRTKTSKIAAGQG